MKYVLVILALMSMTGCASQSHERIDQQDIAIEKVDSDTGRIQLVTLAWDGADLHVRGTVQGRVGEKGRMVGHVRIEALDAAGGVLSGVEAESRRMSIHARFADFSALLNVDRAAVARVRVVHRE
jgi:hypothetical protein